MQAGYIIERKSDARGCGRTPGVLEINAADNYVLGMDVNDTGLTACVMDLRGETLSRHSAPADFSSPKALMQSIFAFSDSALAAHTGKRILAIGVSMQGELDPARGVSLRLPQCPGWKNVPIRAALSAYFGTDVYVAHDPDCMLYNYIETRGGKNVALIRLDKSAGLAAAINGRIVQGSGTMEIAHMIVDPLGPACSCGARGCLDAYLTACARGEAPVSALVTPLATSAHNVIRLFNPETLVLSGELMEKSSLFYGEFINTLRNFFGTGIETKLAAICDASAAMRGAALIAIEGTIAALDIREN